MAKSEAGMEMNRVEPHHFSGMHGGIAPPPLVYNECGKGSSSVNNFAQSADHHVD